MTEWIPRRVQAEMEVQKLSNELDIERGKAMAQYEREKALMTEVRDSLRRVHVTP